MPVEALPRDNGNHTTTLCTFKIVQVHGECKEVREARKGMAAGRGCVGDGKAGAETMSLERYWFSH